MYGFEDIQGWSRLLTVIPKEYRDIIDDAKAQTDFWLNMWFVGLLVIMECTAIVVYRIVWGSQEVSSLWSLMLLYPLGALIIALVSSRGARHAAMVWGDHVKASYDAFLPELGEKLGFPSVITREKQKELWTWFSRAIIYNSQEDMDDLANSLYQAALADKGFQQVDTNSSLGIESKSKYTLLKEADIVLQVEGSYLQEDLKREHERIDKLEAELQEIRRPRLLWRLLG